MSSPRAATSVATSRSARAAAQPAHHPVALLLAHAAVQRLGPVAAAVQGLGELVDLVAGAAEHDGGASGASTSSTRPSAAGFVRARHQVRGLAHLRRLARRRLAPDLDPHRVAQVAPGDARRCARGMVAENSTVCRSSGVARGSPRCPRRSPCRASRRPRRARRSAARRASACPRRCGRAPGPAWPRRRRRRARGPCSWRPMGCAAVDRRATRAPRLAAVAVDRLGHLHGELAGGHEDQRRRASPRRRSGRSARRCSSGRANAAVLPVPVAAWPSRSRPRAAAGSPRPGSGSAPRSPARPGRRAARRAARGRRRWAGRTQWMSGRTLVAAGRSTGALPAGEPAAPSARLLPGRRGLRRA